MGPLYNSRFPVPPLGDHVIVNFTNEEVVHYPVVALKGRTKDYSEISVENIQDPDASISVDSNIIDSNQFFTALIRLKPGVNNIIVNSEFTQSLMTISLTYESAPSRNDIRVVYLTLEDRDGSFPAPSETDNSVDQAVLKTKLWMELAQTSMAESMRDSGFGRQTIAMQLDDDGRPAVDIVALDLSYAEALPIEDDQAGSARVCCSCSGSQKCHVLTCLLLTTFTSLAMSLPSDYLA